MSDEIDLKEATISKLSLKAGDILVVNVNGMTVRQQEGLKESLIKILPKGTHVSFTNGDIYSIISPE